MNLTIKGDVVFSGVKYPFQAGYGTPWRDLALSAGAAMATMGCSVVTSGVGTLACAAGVQFAMPHIYKWLTDSGGRLNPTTGQLERRDDDYCAANCFTYSVSEAVGYIGQTAVSGCNLHAAYLQSFGYQTRAFAAQANDQCYGEYNAGSGWQVNTWQMAKSPRPSDPDDWIPASMDDIAPYMGIHNPDSRVVGEILSRGGEIPLGVPTVTGPSSIQGPEKSKDNADGTREVSRTTYNFNTAGNTITNTSNVTTYNTYNSGGTLTSTRSETETPEASTAQPAEQEQFTQCDKYPQSLGCAELDTPSVPIPKENKNVTFNEESPFSGGACPADAYTSLQTLGGLNVKVVDWATFCGMALPVRFLVLALASIMAFFIIMPGGVRE